MRIENNKFLLISIFNAYKINEMKLFLRKIYLSFDAEVKKIRLKKQIKKGNTKITIGASDIYESGWNPTELSFLNLTKEEDFKALFSLNSIEAIIAEHVWEHLTPEDGKKALANCFKYMKPGAYLRIAVPDGYHESKEYISSVKPGGHGNGSDDHKILYTYQSMSKAMEEVGFKVNLLEYFNEKKEFVMNPWDKKQGNIRRSRYNDPRNTADKIVYTSLIADAVKP